MNWRKREVTKKEIIGNLRERWTKLTEEDVKAIAGKKDLLQSKLQELYGYSKEEAELRVERYKRMAMF